MMALITSRWGVELMGKPSLQSQILIAAATWVVPVGVGLGIARALLERRFSMGPFLVFAATLPTLFVSFALGVGAGQFLPKISLLTPKNAWPPASGSDILPGLVSASLVLLFLACAEYLSNSVGIRNFLLRASIMGGLAFSIFLFQAAANSTLPIAVSEQSAYRNAARSDDAGAARDWAWVIRRAPISSETCHAVEQCALAALRSGNPDKARWALRQVRDPLTREFPCQRTARIAQARFDSHAAAKAAGSV